MTFQKWQHGNCLVCFGHALPAAAHPWLGVVFLSQASPPLPLRHWPAQVSAGPDWTCPTVIRSEESMSWVSLAEDSDLFHLAMEWQPELRGIVEKQAGTAASCLPDPGCRAFHCIALSLLSAPGVWGRSLLQCSSCYSVELTRCCRQLQESLLSLLLRQH